MEDLIKEIDAYFDKKQTTTIVNDPLKMYLSDPDRYTDELITCLEEIETGKIRCPVSEEYDGFSLEFFMHFWHCTYYMGSVEYCDIIRKYNHLFADGNYYRAQVIWYKSRFWKLPTD